MLPVLTALPCTEVTPQTDIRWAGWVLSDVVAEDDNEVLIDGSLTVHDTEGQLLSEGTPSESSPGFYALDVSPDTEISLRITGETIHPTVWRSRTPRDDGYWVYGTLFGVDTEGLELTLSQITDMTGEEISWLSDGDGALIYGAPTMRDAEDQDAWDGATLTALGGDGQAGTVVVLAQDLETGAVGLAAGASGLVGPEQVSGPVVMFFAYDLAPGPVRLIAEGSDGRVAVADWYSEDGDVLSGFHLTFPEEK